MFEEITHIVSVIWQNVTEIVPCQYYFRKLSLCALFDFMASFVTHYSFQENTLAISNPLGSFFLSDLLVIKHNLSRLIVA